ncbi:CRISPR-associated helicase Cas3' [Streptomyces triculaminicus]|uniref:CRISPR-associated helicase Cas3' n=1 Tax=Streptomyces triculaminicus TaxID=2816232 RepID=UPI0037A6574C
MSDFNSPSWTWCWGKTDQDGASSKGGGPAWNPLIAHLLDTAAVTLELWDRYLPAPAQERLAEGFGDGDTAAARTTVAFLAALHDLGKASPAFLGRFGSDQWATRRMREERARWEEQARAAGLPLPETWDGVPEARHEHITALALPSLLGCRCPGTGDGSWCSFEEHQGLHITATCLGAHHGHFPRALEIRGAYAAAGGPAWNDLRAALVESVREQLGLRLEQLPRLVQPVRPATWVLFTGLVVLSDWIASDTRRFPYGSPTDAPSSLWRRSKQRARAAVTDLALDRWRPKETDWGQLWPGTEPRPFQADAIRLMPDKGQALVIVESDTGSGKTRLALWCARHLAIRNGYQGAYLAMPTRAATHQVALEVEAFVPQAVDTDTVNLALVHATAGTTEMVHRLVDAVRVPDIKADADERHDVEDLAVSVQRVFDSSNCDDQHVPQASQVPARAVLDPWYLRRCLGLIATFGVGTIDQVVLSTQRSRHWFLRTFGLACKTVIIDEAHAYELYQQQLLGAAVEWLADAGASVIVLSATLPASVRTALTQSWCTGLRVTAHDSKDQGPITVIDSTGKVRRGGPGPDEVRPLRTTISLGTDPGPYALAARLLDRARDGGCVGVVRNRVNEAIELYKAALAQAEEYGWEPEEVLLLHGRMMPRHRQPMEERLTSLLGPAEDSELRRAGKPNPQRPGRLLVIATQVIEQSLDLDFDHLVSDLAPIDLLIQRRGRQQRHRANDAHRPAWCIESVADGSPPAARMSVLHRPDPRTEELPLVEPPAKGTAAGNADGLIYAPYTLAATYLALTARRCEDGEIRISTPKDNPALLEAVYGTRQTANGACGELLNRTWEAWQASLQNEEKQAEGRVVRPYLRRGRVPADVWTFASGRDHGLGDEGGLPELRAVSRLGEPSTSVVCLYQQADTLTYDAAGTLPVTLGDGLGATARRRRERELLLSTVAMPAHWFRGSNPLPAPDMWPVVHPLLGRRQVALFDTDGTCVVGPVGLVRYDQVTGLTRK